MSDRWNAFAENAADANVSDLARRVSGLDAFTQTLESYIDRAVANVQSAAFNGAFLALSFVTTLMSATGQISIGGALQSNHALDVWNDFAVTAAGINSQPRLTATAAAMIGFEARVRVIAGSVVLTDAFHFLADDVSIGSGSSVTTQVAYYSNALTSATNNYFLYSAGGGISSLGDKLIVRANGADVTGAITGTSTLALGDSITITKETDALLTYQLGGGGQGTARVRASNGTNASPTIIGTSAALYNIDCFAWDGVGYRRAAQLTASVDGAPGAGSMPGKWDFYTTPSGSVSALRRLGIDNLGNVLVGSAVAGATAASTLAFTTEGTSPSATVDKVHLYGLDISAGNRSLAIYQEQAANAAAAVVSTHRLPVTINGTQYALLLTTVLS